MTQLSLEEESAALLASLTEANQAFSARYSGAPERRQPIHTVYGGAQLFRADLSRRLGERALRELDRWAPDAFTFARALGLPGSDTLPTRKKARRLRDAGRGAWLATTVYERVRQKLEREPVEDIRIDFEDGFGVRPDEEEDAAAIIAAEEVARGHLAGDLPPFIGIRIKTLNEELKHRSVRTLDLFFTALVGRLGKLPDSFIVTLPKVQVPEQVRVIAGLLDRLEVKLGLPPKSIQLELMIELTQTLFDASGRFQLSQLVDAAGGRLMGAHFGTYDYTACNDITAAYQTMDHAACQLALGLMKIGYSGTPIFLSDGATNVLPVPIHRGEELKKRQHRENQAAVHRAWALAYRHIRGSLANGIYQGWDLHPAQLPVRYAATYAFFLEGFDPAAARLSNFIDKAAQATLVGDVFDDAATGQGLLNYFLRGLSSGAVTLDELEAIGLTQEEIATRSFVKILAGRSGSRR